jgi:uncharacterized membrane protein HdeD (DUF308 family)
LQLLNYPGFVGSDGIGRLQIMELRKIEPYRHSNYSWKGLIALGILMVILGIIALNIPVASSIGLAWMMGALFFANGVIQFIHSIRYRNTSGTVGRFLLSALSLVAGLIVLRNPVSGTMGITLALTFFLLVESVGKWMLAADLRPNRGWGWLFFSSAVSFLLGMYLIATFPVNSLIVPGIFFGIDLIFYGMACIGLANVARKIEHTITPTQQIPEDRRVA